MLNMLSRLIRRKPKVFIEADSTPKRFELNRDGEVSLVEYSTFEVYFKIKWLESAFNAKPETTLQELATYLESIGLVGCTPEIAKQVYQLNHQQMYQLENLETKQ